MNKLESIFYLRFLGTNNKIINIYMNYLNRKFIDKQHEEYQKELKEEKVLIEIEISNLEKVPLKNNILIDDLKEQSLIIESNMC